MASKFILIVKDGGIAKLPIKKPQAPRKLRVWQEAAAAVASWARAPRFAFRYNGCWHIMRTADATRIKTFKADQQAAAEMYLAHASDKPSQQW